MKTSQAWSKEVLAAAVLCLAGLTSPMAGAQTPPAMPMVQPAPPPPELEKLEEGEPPAVTIRKPGDQNRNQGNSIKERRDHGDTKEVEVQSGPSHYYVHPQKTAGGQTSGEVPSGAVRGAQWKIGEFGGPTKSEQDNNAVATPAKANTGATSAPAAR